MIEALLFGIKFMLGVMGLTAIVVALFVLYLWWLERR
jgi:hypothetical protein